MSGKYIASLLVLVCLFGAPFALTNVNACGTLNSAGETYIVTTDPLSSATVCLNISADNIILDCNGATIDYTGGGSNDHAPILVEGADGVTIRNCIVTNGNHNGILIRDSENLVMRNITTDKCYYGVKVDDSHQSSFSLYDSNIGFTYAGAFAAGLGSAITFLVDGSDFDGGDTGEFAITAEAYNGTIRNNVMHDLGSTAGAGAPFAIRLSGSGSEYWVHNNTIYDFANTAPGAASIRGGIFLENGVHNSLVYNNTIYDSQYGWALVDRFNFATDNTFHSNIVHDVYGGIYCTGSAGHESYNNTIWNIAEEGIRTSCDDANVHNNSVRNADQAFVISGEDVEVYDNLAFESRDGFVITFPGATGWISVHDNEAHSNEESGFQLENGGSADQIYPFQNNLAWNNSIGGFNIAPSGPFPVMSGNTARNNTYGVWFNGGTGGNFSDCSTYDNQIGVVFSGTQGIIFNCEIANNTNMEPLGGTGAGVVFHASTQNEVVNSIIYGNDIGVFINNSDLDTLSGCDVYGNDRQAIWMTGNAFSTQIIDTDSHDNEGGTPPNGLYIDAEGNYPNLTMRNVRLFGNGGFELVMRDFQPSIGGDPAFILEDSIVYGGMEISLGNSGEITDTYFKQVPRGNYFAINAGGPPAAQAIVGTNLGIGLYGSESALGVGADTTRYAYMVYPSISLTQVTLSDAEMGTNFASLDATGAAVEMNEDAEVHLQPNSCTSIKYYFLDGYPTTFEDITTNGAEFVPTASACTGGWAAFAVDHFTGYAAQGTPSEDGGGEPEDYECITNADCPPCEICSAHECILPSGSCNTVADCYSREGAIFICEECACIPVDCTTDEQCDEGYTCDDNVCVPPECVSDSDCPQGYACDGFECWPPECTSNSDCPDDEACVDYECTGKGGGDEEGEGQSGQWANITPEQPGEQEPPLIVPVEIGEEIIPLVEPAEEERQEEWGVWQTATTAAAFVIALLVLGALIYFLTTKKKKKKAKREED